MSFSLLQITFQRVMVKLFQFLDLLFFDGSSLQKKSRSFHQVAQLRSLMQQHSLQDSLQVH